MFHNQIDRRAILVAATLTLAACSGSSTPTADIEEAQITTGDVEPTAPEAPPATSDVEAPPATEATPTTLAPGTTTTSTTLPPAPVGFDVEDTIYDPVDLVSYGDRQRGLRTSGPDRFDGNYVEPPEPDGPCGFSTGGGANSSGFVTIDACEFDDETTAAAYVEARRAWFADADEQLQGSDDAVLTASADVGPFAGVSIAFPRVVGENFERPASQIARLVGQYGMRTYEITVRGTVRQDAAASEQADVAAELAQLQMGFWEAIGLAPDSPGAGFDDAPERYSIDAGLLPVAQVSELVGEFATTFRSDLQTSGLEFAGFGNIARESSRIRTIEFGDDTTVWYDVERYDTAGDATRRFSALNSALPSSSPASPIEGVPDAVREDDRSEADTVRLLSDDRIYSFTVSRPSPAIDVDGELVVRLASALVAHLSEVGLDDPAADDVALESPSTDFDLEVIFPTEIALDDDRRISLSSLTSSPFLGFDGERGFRSSYLLDGAAVGFSIEARHDARTGFGYDGDIPLNPETWSVRPNESPIAGFGSVSFAKIVGDHIATVSIFDDALAASGGDATASNLIIRSFDAHLAASRLADLAIVDPQTFIAVARPLALVDPAKLGGQAWDLGDTFFQMQDRSDVPDMVRSAGGVPDDAPDGALAVWQTDIDIADDGTIGASMRAIRFESDDDANAHVDSVLGPDGVEPVRLVDIGGIIPVGNGGTFAMASGRWAFVIENTRLSAAPNTGSAAPSSPLDALRTGAVGHALLILESGLR